MSSFKNWAIVLLATVVFIVLGSATAQAEIVFASPSNDLALAGTASMSSWPSWASGQNADKGNDGNRYGGVANAPSYSFIHTDYDVNPWWKVTLAAPASIGSILVFNRTDVADIGIRLNPFTVEVFSDSTLVWSSGTITTFTPDIILGSGQARGQTFSLPSPVTGNIVKVTHNATDYFNLAEVEVYAPIPEPNTLFLSAMGIVGLLAYAWRKRR